MIIAFVVVGASVVGHPTSPIPTFLLAACGLFVFSSAAWVVCWHSDKAIGSRVASLEAQSHRTLDEGRPAQNRLAEAQHDLALAERSYGRILQVFQSRLNRLLTYPWHVLTGVTFENFLAEVFQQLGYAVETTKATGDQGVDLIISKNGTRIAVQAKGYPCSSVGNKAVQEVHAGMKLYGCHAAVVVTNSKFTRSASQLASVVGCTMLDRTQIPDLIRGRIRL